MRVGDILYFSPDLPFRDLDIDNPDAFAMAYEDRMEGFYLRPAMILANSGYPFAVGLLTLAAVEFMGFSYGEKPVEWLSNHLQLPENIAQWLWSGFRDKLSHEGRVRSGEFSYDLDSMYVEEDGILVVNPGILLENVGAAFHQFCSELSPAQKIFLRDNLRRHFKAEVEAAQRPKI
jgi:hypothetical protein